MTSVGAVIHEKAGIRHLRPGSKGQTRSDLLENGGSPGLLDHSLSWLQVTGRVLFSCSSTLLTALSVYVAIRWMAGT